MGLTCSIVLTRASFHVLDITKISLHDVLCVPSQIVNINKISLGVRPYASDVYSPTTLVILTEGSLGMQKGAQVVDQDLQKLVDVDFGVANLVSRGDNVVLAAYQLSIDHRPELPMEVNLVGEKYNIPFAKFN